MKKIALGLLSAILFASCDPVMNDRGLGKVLNESELQLEVYATTPGGNEIVMINNTPEVGTFWDHITGVSTLKKTTVVLPFKGEQTIKFTGFCEGGKVTTSRKVNITKIDHPVDPVWGLLAGADYSGKSWVWDRVGRGDAVYGIGGWLVDVSPTWWTVPINEVLDLDAEIRFDLAGGPNLTKLSAQGAVLEKGSFAFDMQATKKNASDGSPWSIGQLKLNGVSVLNGCEQGNAANVIKTFEILVLTEETMVLCWGPPAGAPFATATYWCFRKK